MWSARGTVRVGARCPAGRCIIMGGREGGGQRPDPGLQEGRGPGVEAACWTATSGSCSPSRAATGSRREDAADVSQLTFTILIQSLDSLRRRATCGVARHRRPPPHLAPDGERPPRGHRQGGRPGRERGAARRREAIRALGAHRLAAARASRRSSDACRELLVALYFDERQPSYAEIAERLGMPVGSIGPTRARCLRRMRQALGRAVMRASERFSAPGRIFARMPGSMSTEGRFGGLA